MTTLNMKNNLCIQTVKMLGDFWTLRIIDALSDEELRYCELQRNAGNVNPVTLANRLKKLEVSKIVERTQASRSEVKYSLTPLGREALTVLEAINVFTDRANKLGTPQQAK